MPYYEFYICTFVFSIWFPGRKVQFSRQAKIIGLHRKKKKKKNQEKKNQPNSAICSSKLDCLSGPDFIRVETGCPCRMILPSWKWLQSCTMPSAHHVTIFLYAVSLDRHPGWGCFQTLSLHGRCSSVPGIEWQIGGSSEGSSNNQKSDLQGDVKKANSILLGWSEELSIHPQRWERQKAGAGEGGTWCSKGKKVIN